MDIIKWLIRTVLSFALLYIAVYAQIPYISTALIWIAIAFVTFAIFFMMPLFLPRFRNRVAKAGLVKNKGLTKLLVPYYIGVTMDLIVIGIFISQKHYYLAFGFYFMCFTGYLLRREQKRIWNEA
jgi:hypothetical protein